MPPFISLRKVPKNDDFPQIQQLTVLAGIFGGTCSVCIFRVSIVQLGYIVHTIIFQPFDPMV